ncbi:MAG: hypothetical protein AAF483_06015 [Planctomycetota bacterium]
MTPEDLEDIITSHFKSLAADDQRSSAAELEWNLSFGSQELDRAKLFVESLDPIYESEIFYTPPTGEEPENAPALPIDINVFLPKNLSENDVKTMIGELLDSAALSGLVCNAIECGDQLEWDESLGWIEPSQACSRLKELVEILPEDSPKIPWCFLISMPSLDVIAQVKTLLSNEGLADWDEYGDADEDGRVGMSIFCVGNQETELLKNLINRISTIFAPHHGILEGVQFYTRDDLADIFETD